MARKTAREDAAKKKAKKQKKLLVVLGLLLVGAGFFAFTTLSSLGKKPVSATPDPATTPAGSISTGEPVSAVIAGIAAPPPGSLRAFTAFGRRDPFTSGPSLVSESSTTNADGSGKGSIADQKGNGNGSGSNQPSGPLTGAVISLNGNKLALAVGSKFGHAPGLSGVPLFRLVHVTAKTALIAVVGTHQHFLLHVRYPLTLQQNGGWTYTLILEPLGTAAPMTVQPIIHDQQP